MRSGYDFLYKFSFLLIFLITLSFAGLSQNQPDFLESVDSVGNNITIPEKGKKRKLPVRKKLFFGGYFSLRFGTITDIELAPIVGYQLTPRLSFATGIKYEYYSDRYYNYDTHIYGFKVFSRFNVIQDLNNIIPAGINMSIFIHAEYEGLSLESRYFDSGQFPGQERFWLNTILVGGGIRQPLGPRAGLYFSILWNLNDNINSIYSNPIFRIGFSF